MTKTLNRLICRMSLQTRDLTLDAYSVAGQRTTSNPKPFLFGEPYDKDGYVGGDVGVAVLGNYHISPINNNSIT